MNKRIYVDMDGTLCVFGHVDSFEELLEKGYFLNRPPMENVIEAVKILEEETDIEVHILSAYLEENKYAKKEKKLWLKKYLPWLDKERIHLVKCGISKFSVAKSNNLNVADAVLLDDYSVNLREWGSVAIKVMNGINGNNGSWKGKPSVSAFDKPEKIAEDIVKIVKKGEKNE